eukprot:gene4903-8492_t
MKQKTSKHIVMPLIGGGAGDDYIESILKGKKKIYENLRFYFKEAIKNNKIQKEDYSLKNFKLYRDYLDSESNNKNRIPRTRNTMADIMNNQVDLIIKEAEKREKEENKKVNDDVVKMKQQMDKLENERKAKQKRITKTNLVSMLVNGNSAYVVGFFFMLDGIINVFAIPSPMWFNVLDIVFGYLPMSFIAMKIFGSKKNKTQ